MERSEPRIELEITGRPESNGRVPLRTFARATDTLTDLLSELISSDHKPGTRVQWWVQNLRPGSTILSAEAASDTIELRDAARSAIRTAVDAVERLESDRNVRTLVSFAALERIRTLGNLLNNGAGGIILRDLGSGTEASLTDHGTHQATTVLREKRYSYGSTEGAIETISIHEARPYFNVFHILDGHAIKCVCDEDLLDTAQESMRRKARVRVSGSLVRRFDGRIESIEVERITIVPGNKELPQPSEIKGIDPALTGGRSVREWLRSHDD